MVQNTLAVVQTGLGTAVQDCCVKIYKVSYQLFVNVKGFNKMFYLLLFQVSGFVRQRAENQRVGNGGVCKIS